MDKRFIKICEYVDLRSPWRDDNLPEIIWKKSQIAAKKLSMGKDKNGSLIRIAGQTGSGKTSQVLWAIEEFNKIKNKNPIVLGVRSFVEFYPNYEELIKTCKKEEIREITNGFALKCFVGSMFILMKEKFDMIFDLTFLAPEFEKCILDVLNENEYKVTYHVLAVNTQISSVLLEKRFKDSGRIVYSSSKDYFNMILNQGFKFICENDEKNNCFIWTAFDKKYVYNGLVGDAFDVFLKNQNRIEPLEIDENELKKEKLKALLA